MIGNHNISNATASIAIALNLGIEISKIKGVILEASILDELYVNFNIWGFQSLSKIVISPSLIIKSNEINYFFDSLEKILKQGSKKIIRKYINRLTK